MTLCGASITNAAEKISSKLKAKMASITAPFRGHCMVFFRKVNAVYLCLSLEVSCAIRVNYPFLFNISATVIRLWTCLVLSGWCFTVIVVFMFFRLFERGLAYVGTDYLSFPLWDKYIEYEYMQQEWSRLAMIYTQILENPNQQLDRYFNRWFPFLCCPFGYVFFSL